MKKPYYITTAIAYTSGYPHIGNDYEIILGDAIARFKRIQGYDVYFQTGTDEHGQKIQQKAAEHGMKTQDFVDEIAGKIKSIYDLMNCSYDHFVRTTDPMHEAQVKKIFKRLYDQGDIYLGKYEGWYCVPCESFFTDTQVKDDLCPDCASPINRASEDAYFFKLSQYQDRLIEHIKKHPEFIEPESRRKEMLNNFLKETLPDLCVSRTSFDWGVEVEFAPGHVVYVWIDALSNYITGIGFDADGNHAEAFKKYWPADLHLIGKDILRFHTIYWPSILMALNLPLPKQVFGHPWILVNKGKMSKSKGNVMYTEKLVEHFGVDAVRYYVLHEIPFAQDGNITYELLIERINSDLANTLGNLVNRTLAMSHRYRQGVVTKVLLEDEFAMSLTNTTLETKRNVVQLMEHHRVSDAMEEIMVLCRRANKFIDETEPWVLAKDPNNPRLDGVLYALLESIRFIGVLLQPFMPSTASSILAQVNTDLIALDSLDVFGHIKDQHQVNEGTPLFQRLDAKKKLEAILSEENKEESHIEVPEITMDDFAKVELVVGKILESKPHPNATSLLISNVDIGHEVRQIVSGIASWTTPEELIGKSVMVVTNLKAIKLRGVLSEGMILCGSNDNYLEVLFVQNLNPGDKIK